MKTIGGKRKRFCDLVRLVHLVIFVHLLFPSGRAPATTYGNVLAKSMHKTSQGPVERDLPYRQIHKLNQ